MQYVFLLIVCAVVFGTCFLADKGFSRLFRNRREHKTGLAVRHGKKVAAIGLAAIALGVAAFFAAAEGGAIFYIGGAVLCLLGIFLVVMYTTFGVFYSEDTFLVTTFGKKSVCYSYKDIRTQQLYNNMGAILIELHMADGRSVQQQSRMEGVYPFMDKAFSGWLRQKGLNREECSFYDPQNSRWFPEMEE